MKEPSLDDVMLLFPKATSIEPDGGDSSVLRVRAPDGTSAGWCLRTSPVADKVIGYQGPTDAIVGFDAENRVVGVAVLASFDNEPYVGYVRDDEAFRGLWRGMPIAELVGLDPVDHGVEGVSGATMTSQAVAEGIVRTARDWQERIPPDPARAAFFIGWLKSIEPPQWGAIALVLVGLATAFTRLRGTWFGRVALPLAMLLYLGFGAEALISLAQLLGWSQAGIPSGAVVLTVLTLVAIATPATARRNVYCSHVCAHGAAQQLILRVAMPKGHLPRQLRPWLTLLPWTLLAVALLDHLRLNRKSGFFTWRDAVLLVCLAAASAVYVSPW